MKTLHGGCLQRKIKKDLKSHFIQTSTFIVSDKLHPQEKAKFEPALDTLPITSVGVTLPISLVKHKSDSSCSQSSPSGVSPGSDSELMLITHDHTELDGDSGFSTEDCQSEEQDDCPPILEKITDDVELMDSRSQSEDESPPVLERIVPVEDRGEDFSYSSHPMSVCGDLSSPSSASFEHMDDQALSEEEDTDTDRENDSAHCFCARTFWTPADWKEVKKCVDILQSNYEGFESAIRENQCTVGRDAAEQSQSDTLVSVYTNALPQDSAKKSLLEESKEDGCAVGLEDEYIVVDDLEQRDVTSLRLKRCTVRLRVRDMV